MEDKNPDVGDQVTRSSGRHSQQEIMKQIPFSPLTKQDGEDYLPSSRDARMIAADSLDRSISLPEQLFTARLTYCDLPANYDELFQLEQFALFDGKQALKNCGSHRMLVELLTLMIVQEIPADLQHLQNAFAQNDYLQVEKIAHKIKGGAMYVGTTRMKFACQYVERYWKTGETDLFAPLYHQAIQVIENTATFLNEWLSHNA